MKVKQHD